MSWRIAHLAQAVPSPVPDPVATPRPGGPPGGGGSGPSIDLGPILSALNPEHLFGNVLLPWKLEVELSSQPGYAYDYTPGGFGDEGDAPLELAYAITVHRAQGSEFGRTVLVLPRDCRPLSRELLYTALTRQKERVVILHQGDLTQLKRYADPSFSETVSAELELLVRFLSLASREARQGLGACAVLVPSEVAGRSLATRLTTARITAAFMPGREMDLEKPIVKVITLQSAKGLEFPVVAVAGFVDAFPQLGGSGGEAEEAEEALARQRRTMFVTMTRAMRSLLVVPPDNPSRLFEGFDPQLWNVSVPTVSR